MALKQNVFGSMSFCQFWVANDVKSEVKRPFYPWQKIKKTLFLCEFIFGYVLHIYMYWIYIYVLKIYNKQIKLCFLFFSASGETIILPLT
jgi:hypothetical protein